MQINVKTLPIYCHGPQAGFHNLYLIVEHNIDSASHYHNHDICMSR